MVKLSKKGIGKAEDTAHIETRQHIYIALGELQPPTLQMTEPPTTTPNIGAEIQVNAQYNWTVEAGCLSTSQE